MKKLVQPSIVVLFSVLLFCTTSSVSYSQNATSPDYVVGYATRGPQRYDFAGYHIAHINGPQYQLLDLSMVSEVPVWSTDSTQIALVHRPLAFYSPSGYYPQVISLLNASGVYQDTILEPQSFVRFVHWSTDGQQLIFLSAPVSDAVIENLSIVNVDGRERQPLLDLPDTLPALYIIDMAWSPDSSQIAFVGGDVKESELYVVQRDGSDLKLVADGFRIPFGSDNIVWASDQQSILLLGRLLSSSQETLLEIHLNTGKIERHFAEEDSFLSFVLAPDGSEVAFLTGDGFLRIYDLISERLVLEIEIGLYQPDYGVPQWSPDGNYITFSAVAKEDVPAQIFVLNIEDEILQMVTYEPTDAIYPHWLPVGISPYTEQ